MYQAFTLGLKSRQRYKQLLLSNDVYLPDEMYVRSSAKKRCIMTARHFLTGFSLSDNDPDSLSVSSQPVAINIIAKERDKVRSSTKP